MNRYTHGLEHPWPGRRARDGANPLLVLLAIEVALARLTLETLSERRVSKLAAWKRLASTPGVSLRVTRGLETRVMDEAKTSSLGRLARYCVQPVGESVKLDGA